MEIGQETGADERGFAAAGGANHGHKSVPTQPAEDLLALPLAPEEQILLVRLERPKPGKRMNGRLDRHRAALCRGTQLLHERHDHVRRERAGLAQHHRFKRL